MKSDENNATSDSSPHVCKAHGWVCTRATTIALTLLLGCEDSTPEKEAPSATTVDEVEPTPENTAGEPTPNATESSGTSTKDDMQLPTTFEVDPAAYSVVVEKAGNGEFVLRLNSVEVMQLAAGEKQDTERVEGWIQPGSNEIELTQAAGSEGKLKLEILRLAPGDSPSEAERVLQKEIDTPLGSSPHPLKFTVNAPPTGKLWREAEILAVNDETREAALDAARALHTAVTEGDEAELARWFNFKAEDLGPSMGLTPETGVEHQAKFLRILRSKKLAPLADKLDIEFVASNRAVRVRNDGAPLIATTKGAPAIDIYLGRIDGRWAVVR